MDGDKDEEKAETWILNLSVEDLDRLDGLERARRLKTEECSKDKDKPQQKVDGDFLHYLFCKEKLTGKKMVRWADFEDWHKKMSPMKPPQLEAEDHSEEHKLGNGNFANCPVRGNGTSGFVKGNMKGQVELGQWNIDVQEDPRAGNTLMSTC